jgi:hypothetical protein
LQKKLLLESRGNFVRSFLRMKTRTILMGLMAGWVMTPLVALADDTPLATQMEVMNDAYKAFRKETDPAKGAALAREAQTAMLKAISEEPEMVKKMPAGSDKDKASAAYRKMMGKLYVTLCEVEEAFLAGDMAKVAELVAALRESKKAGHDRFMEE